eukprot:1193064-Prorocentrum_minimum.AAC.1
MDATGIGVDATGINVDGKGIHTDAKGIHADATAMHAMGMRASPPPCLSNSPLGAPPFHPPWSEARCSHGPGRKGKYRSSVDAREPRNGDDEVKNTGGICKVCCTVHEGHKRPRVARGPEGGPEGGP